LAAVSCVHPKGKQDGTGLNRLVIRQEKPAIVNNGEGIPAYSAAGQKSPVLNSELDNPALSADQTDSYNREVLLYTLENLIEQERSGSFVQGMGIRESMIRETLGDFGGAVMAAYKELAWAYSMGIIDRAAMEQGMQNAFSLGDIPSLAAQACIAFMQGKWAEPEAVLRQFGSGDEIDSLNQWMILSCILEQNHNDRQASDAYRVIRGRYAKFPEYWYRGARVFTGNFSAEYAEYCLALAPKGPYADECRAILAAVSGLSQKDGQFLLSRPEIEQLISRSVNQGDPRVLDQLMPLISLPDNSYTVYAVNLLRTLASVPQFRDYFRDSSNRSTGRLAERLAYISRTGI